VLHQELEPVDAIRAKRSRYLIWIFERIMAV
jgi:hypothetical protein